MTPELSGASVHGCLAVPPLPRGLLCSDYILVQTVPDSPADARTLAVPLHFVKGSFLTRRCGAVLIARVPKIVHLV